MNRLNYIEFLVFLLLGDIKGSGLNPDGFTTLEIKEALRETLPDLVINQNDVSQALNNLYTNRVVRNLKFTDNGTFRTYRINDEQDVDQVVKLLDGFFIASFTTLQNEDRLISCILTDTQSRDDRLLVRKADGQMNTIMKDRLKYIIKDDNTFHFNNGKLVN